MTFQPNPIIDFYDCDHILQVIKQNSYEKLAAKQKIEEIAKKNPNNKDAIYYYGEAMLWFLDAASTDDCPLLKAATARGFNSANYHLAKIYCKRSAFYQASLYFEKALNQHEDFSQLALNDLIRLVQINQNYFLAKILAKYYFYGYGNQPVNYQKAFAYLMITQNNYLLSVPFDRNDDSQHAEIYYLLGKSYQYGYGTPIDVNLAAEYYAKTNISSNLAVINKVKYHFQKLIENNPTNKNIILLYGQFLLRCKMVTQGDLLPLIANADAGSFDAKNILADHYKRVSNLALTAFYYKEVAANKSAPIQDRQRAVFELKHLSKRDPNVLCNLAICYLNAYGTFRDYQAARTLLRLVNKNYPNNDIATCQLAIMFENGYGVEKDLQLSISYYLNAAQKNSDNKDGSLYAINRIITLTKAYPHNEKIQLAYIECLCEGVIKIHSQADLDSLAIGASMQNVLANYRLAEAYSCGIFVNTDVNSAAYYFLNVIKHGNNKKYSQLAVKHIENLATLHPHNPNILHALAYCYDTGLLPNQKKCISYYQSAMQYGSYKAAFNLAQAYRHGNYVKKDLALAAQAYLNCVKYSNDDFEIKALAFNKLQEIYQTHQSKDDIKLTFMTAQYVIGKYYAYSPAADLKKSVDYLVKVARSNCAISEKAFKLLSRLALYQPTPVVTYNTALCIEKGYGYQSDPAAAFLGYHEVLNQIQTEYADKKQVSIELLPIFHKANSRLLNILKIDIANNLPYQQFSREDLLYQRTLLCSLMQKYKNCCIDIIKNVETTIKIQRKSLRFLQSMPKELIELHNLLLNSATVPIANYFESLVTIKESLTQLQSNTNVTLAKLAQQCLKTLEGVEIQFLFRKPVENNSSTTYVLGNTSAKGNNNTIDPAEMRTASDQPTSPGPLLSSRRRPGPTPDKAIILSGSRPSPG